MKRLGKKIIRKVQIESLRQFITDKAYRSSILHHDKMGTLAKNEATLWRGFLYLKRKYSLYLYSLPRYQYVNEHPKIIWWCWLQGEKKAPDICKVCLASIRKNYPDYEIRIITEENMFRYFTPPQLILYKYQKGIIPHAHFSDILRTYLLVEYGGTWIDSTVYVTGDNMQVLDKDLFVFNDWKFNQQSAAIASNWLISANKGNPILRTVLDLLYKYWEDNDTLVDYFIYHLFFHMVTEKYPEEWRRVPRFSNIPPHILQFELFDKFSAERYNQICKMSDFHKLTYKFKLQKNNIKDTFYGHIIRSI